MNNNLKGFAYGIATSVTFGLIPLFTLPLMEKGMRFDSILFYRFLFAAIALSGMLLAKKESFRTEMRNLPILILLGAFYTGSAMFLFWGYNFMAGGDGPTPHFSSSLILIPILMLFVFKEKTSWITLLAIGLAICGVARLSIDGGEMRLNGLGVIIVLLSAVAYALYIVTVNKSRVHDMPGRKLTFYVFIVSTSLFFIKAQAGTGIQPIPDLPSFINLVLLAFLPTVVSNITLVQAVHHIGSTLTSVLGATEPVTAVCVGVLVFGEPFTPHLALGILLIIVAVTLIILSKYIQKNLHEAKRLFKARHILRTK